MEHLSLSYLTTPDTYQKEPKVSATRWVKHVPLSQLVFFQVALLAGRVKQSRDNLLFHHHFDYAKLSQAEPSWAELRPGWTWSGIGPSCTHQNCMFDWYDCLQLRLRPNYTALSTLAVCVVHRAGNANQSNQVQPGQQLYLEKCHMWKYGLCNSSDTTNLSQIQVKLWKIKCNCMITVIGRGTISAGKKWGF